MKYFSIILLLVFLFSCSKNEKMNHTNSQVLDPENLDWLVGEWNEVSNSTDEQLIINWKKDDKENYSGEFLFKLNNITLSKDNLIIFKENNNWYIVISGFDKPILYNFKSVGENKFIAEESFPFYIDFWYEEKKLKVKIKNEEFVDPLILEKVD